MRHSTKALARAEILAPTNGEEIRATNSSPPKASNNELRDSRTRTGSQPLEAAQDDDALLKIQTFGALAGLSDSSVFRLLAAGELTAIKRGKRCTRIRAGQARAWLNAQGADK